MRSEALLALIKEKVEESYQRREKELSPSLLRHIERMILLQMIDTAWKEHLYDLDQLRKGIGLRAYGQKDPKIEYQRESFSMFEQMMRRIREASIEYLFRVQVTPEPVRRAPVAVAASGPSIKTERTAPVQAIAAPKPGNSSDQELKPINKLGRNDPCPCGSGKKYKKCCGA